MVINLRLESITLTLLVSRVHYTYYQDEYAPACASVTKDKYSVSMVGLKTMEIVYRRLWDCLPPFPLLRVV